MTDIITASNLTLGYESNQSVIKEANFTINVNDFVIITGESGSGKSTLLNSLYGAIKPKSGSLNVCMSELNGISARELRTLRQKIGVVFQDYRLINEWTIEKNVMLPLLISGDYDKHTCDTQVANLLQHVKLAHKMGKYPLELSGGEQQRVGVARAMCHNPQLLLCDEPTGNLDEYSSNMVWALLRSANEAWGACVIVVTHSKPSMHRFKFRHFDIKDGKVNEVS